MLRCILALIVLAVLSASDALAQQPRQTAEPPLAHPQAISHAPQPACHGDERTFYTPVRNAIAFIREHRPLRTAAGNVACGVVCRVRCCARGR